MSWKTVKLEKLCKMNSGGTPSRSIKKYYSGDISWAKISDIEAAEGGIIYSTEEHITKDGLNAISNRIFEKGTLLLAMYGSVGKVAFAGVEMSTNQAILGIRIIDEAVLNYSYLKYWFQTIKSKLLDRAVGGTLQNISLGIVKDLEIPLPPLATQKRIAEILDAADALRRKDQELLKKYDELAQAIFIDMFGDPVKNEKGWEVKNLGDICDFYSGRAWKNAELSSSGIKLVRISNLHKTNFPFWHYNGELIQKLKVEDGDLLFSWAGVQSSIDVYLYSGETAMLNQHIFNIKPKNDLVLKKFLFDVIRLHLKDLRLSLGGGVGQFHLKKEDVTGIKIILPSLIETNHYIKTVNKIDTQISYLKQNAVNSENMFNSLLIRAFEGELVK